MSIFFWFLIIAVVTLAINMTVILHMKKQRSIHALPIIAILIAGYLAAALLYLLISMHGTEILDQKTAVRLEIEPQSYQTASDGTHTSFAFCSTEGITFSFDSSQLLTTDFPEKPSIVEVCVCKVRNGFSACYLSEGTTIGYLLK